MLEISGLPRTVKCRGRNRKFFSEVAHRLSTEADGSYKPEKGLETLKKYATMFGLDRTSGIEISEATPSISDTDPERSSMGQGTHQFASVQLARYVTALANRGTVYDLSLIDKETDSQGNLVKDYWPVRPVRRRSPRNGATTRSLFRLHRMRIRKFR